MDESDFDDFLFFILMRSLSLFPKMIMLSVSERT